MRHTNLATGLFVGFTAILLAVGWLDRYSAHYKACGKLWTASLDAATDNPYFKDYVAEKLAEPGSLSHDGRACPALRQAHVQKVQARLGRSAR